MKVGFIGAGQMAQALVSGFAHRDSAGISDFVVSDPCHDAVADFESKLGKIKFSRADSNSAVFDSCDLVFIAVKPQTLEAALEKTGTHQPVIVSIVAGVAISKLIEMTGIKTVIRVMPNTPCLIGQGASAMTASTAVPVETVSKVRNLLESVGSVTQVAEKDMDAVTGLSGSGPAYVFSFLEGLINGAVSQGLEKGVAKRLALQTVIGAARLADESCDDLETLRKRVTSPGGTTMAGLNALNSQDFIAVTASAVQAATKRSIELGKN